MFLLEKYYDFISTHANMPHTSKFHSESFPEHIADVFERVCLANSLTPHSKRILALSALLHDIGKPATMFVDRDNNARFFSHEVMSTIMVDEFLTNDDVDFVIVKNLVACHMLPFQTTYPNIKDALTMKFGSAFVDLLDTLHEGDIQKFEHHNDISNIIDNNDYDIRNIVNPF